MGSRSNSRKRGNGRSKSSPSSLRQGLTIGTIAFFIAIVTGGPIGTLLQGVDVLTGVVVLILIILFGVCADVIAVAATAANDVPLNAMASDKVPGAQEALVIVRNAGRVNSIFGDIVGDIAGTISGVVATPVIFALSELYPQIPQVAVSALVIGLVAFFTIGGKAAEKDFAVRQSTLVILWVGKLIYLFNRIRRLGRKGKQSSR